MRTGTEACLISAGMPIMESGKNSLEEVHL